MPTYEAQLKSQRAALTEAVNELAALESRRPTVAAGVYVHGQDPDELESLHAAIAKTNNVIGGLQASIAELQAKQVAKQASDTKKTALVTSAAEDEAASRLARIEATLADLTRRRADVEREQAELVGLRPALQAAGLVRGDKAALERLEDLGKRQQVLADTLIGIDHAAGESSAERQQAEVDLKQAQLLAGAAKVRAAVVRRAEIIERFKQGLAAAGGALDELGTLCEESYGVAQLLEADAKSRGEQLPDDLQSHRFRWNPLVLKEASAWTAKIIGRSRGPFAIQLDDAERVFSQLRL